LPRQQRAVLVLRYCEDLPEAEVAEILGCSVGTVKTHAHRGVAALRERLGGEFGWLGSTGTVDVDQQGRVRRLDATETTGRTVHKTRVTFGDFGLAVSVSPPPASETFIPPAENLGPRPALSPSPADSG
jgi:hypothetical protein